MSAEATLKLLLIGEDRSAGKALKGVGDQSEKTHSKLQGVANIAGKALAGGLLVAGAAALKFAKGAAEDETAASKLAQTMGKTAHATKGQIAQTEEWITAQGKATGITDDELRPALSKLVAATHDVGKAQKLASLAMDISAGSGKSLEAVSAALARAQNGNVGALSRLGIKTKDSVKDNAALEAANIRVAKAQSDYTAALDKFGPHSKEAHLAASKLEYAQTKLGEAQHKTKTSTIDATEAMKRLSDTYGGAASKAAETTAGKQKILTTQLSEAGETIGYKLLPFMLKLTEAGVAALGWMTAHPKLMKEITVTVAGLAVAVVVLRAGLLASAAASKVMAISQAMQAVAAGTATEAQIALNTAMRANLIGLIVTGLILLVGGLILAYKKSETFRDIVNGAFHGVAAAVDFVKDHWKLLISLIMGPFGVAIVAVVTHFDAIKTAARVAIKFVVDTFLGMVGVIVHGAADAFGWVPGLGGKLKGAADAFDRFRDRVNSALDGIHSEKDIHLNVTTHQSVSVSSINKPRVQAGGAGHSATGARFLSGGAQWVGERGPELAWFPRGTSISTAADSASMSGGGAGGDLGTLEVVVRTDTGEIIEQKLVKLKRQRGTTKLAFVS